MLSMLSLIGRSEPLFETDISTYEKELASLVAVSCFLVIGGAGSIGSALDMECFNTIGIIKNDAVYEEQKLQLFTDTIQSLRIKGYWNRDEVIDLFNQMIPEFNHKETGRFLDSKM